MTEKELLIEKYKLEQEIIKLNMKRCKLAERYTHMFNLKQEGEVNVDERER